jgi:NAD-dependent SIR2 family protein deacetylase
MLGVRLTCVVSHDSHLDSTLVRHSSAATVAIAGLVTFESADSCGKNVPIRGLIRSAIRDIEVSRSLVCPLPGVEDPQAGIDSLLKSLEALYSGATLPFEITVRCPEGESDIFPSSNGYDAAFASISRTTFRRTAADDARLGVLNLPSGAVLSTEKGERSAAGVKTFLERKIGERGLASAETSGGSGSDGAKAAGDAPLGLPRVVCLIGAGVSVNAGIAPFRGAPDAVYATVSARYPELAKPQDLFSIDFFRENPRPFFDFRAQMWDADPQPTKAHRALADLVQRGLVAKVFSQNVDGLCLKAGVPPEKLVQVHGSFDTARCDSCGIDCPMERLRDAAHLQEIPHCVSSDCGGVARPNVVMFGEAVPELDLERECENCDLLLILGTSLAVPPINDLHRFVPHDCVRVFINKEPPPDEAGFDFDGPDGRDVFLQGDCDDIMEELGL